MSPPATIPVVRRRSRDVAIAVAALVSVWVLAMLGPLSLLMPVVPVGLLAVRRWRAAVACVLLSPPVLAFALGVADYCRGRARLVSPGLPGTTSFNLDPDLRCGWATSGCLVYGNEWVTQSPNNLAVSAMTRLFGPQRGAYTGAYPTEEEAVAAVAGAPAVPVSQVVADAINVGGRTVRLDRGVGAGLLAGGGRGYYDPSLPGEAAAVAPDESGPIRAAVWKDACLVLRIPAGAMNEPGEPVQAACVAVCDLRTGRPFAYYAEGRYYHRFPPVPWRR
jgi:hypothetical protein